MQKLLISAERFTVASRLRIDDFVTRPLVARMRGHMEADPNAQHEANPVAATTEASGAPDAIQIQLTIERQAVIAYLRTIEPQKREIALLHALEIGINELGVRRERFASSRPRH